MIVTELITPTSCSAFAEISVSRCRFAASSASCSPMPRLVSARLSVRAEAVPKQQRISEAKMSAEQAAPTMAWASQVRPSSCRAKGAPAPAMEEPMETNATR